MKKQKAKSMFKSSLIFVFLAAGCSSAESQAENFKEADKVAYEYILATIEQDDDRKEKILTEEALVEARNNHILIEGRHENKGAAEALKENYEIRRYDNLYSGDELYYKVSYIIPFNNERQSDTEYIKMKKDKNDQWRLTSATGILNDEKEEVFPKEIDKTKGTLVHPQQN